MDKLPWFDGKREHDLKKIFRLMGCPKAGDVICFRSSGFVSWAIRTLTNGYVNHVGIMVDDVNIVHARAKYGVVMMPLAQYMAEHWKTKAYIRRLTEAPDKYKDAQEALNIVINYAKQAINRPYDNLAIFSLTWRSLLKPIPILGPLLFKIPIVQKRLEHFCSELVELAFEQIGLSFKGKHHESTVTPHDIAKSNLLQTIETF